MQEDIYIRYLRYHFQEHGTINDIHSGYTVIFEGQKLNIYTFLNSIKTRHNAYVNGKVRSGATSTLSLSRYKALDEMNFSWTDNRLKKEEVQEEIQLRYLRKHFKEHCTINDIPITAIVVFEGQELKIGSYLRSIRDKHSLYVKGVYKRSNNTKTALTRYQVLEQLGIDWSNQNKKTAEEVLEEKAIRYLQAHYTEFGTINDISTKEVVEFEGETLRIGDYLNKIREKHRLYLKGENKKASFTESSLTRYQLLDEMNFAWELDIKKTTINSECDPYIEYLQTYYKIHGSLEGATLEEIVEYKGQKLNIRHFINQTRYAYKQHLLGENSSFSSSLYLRRYEALKELNFDFSAQVLIGISDIAKVNGINPRTLSGLAKKFNGDVDKATKIALSKKRYLHKKRKQHKKKYNLESVSKEFEMDIEKLTHTLNKDSLQTTPRKEKLMYSKTMSLREFCIRNSLNYSVISKAVRLRMNDLSEEELPSLINRCITEYKINGQNKPSTWIYSKYGNELLVRHLILSLEFDPDNILRDMSKNAISIEEAFEQESIRRYLGKDYKYLTAIYHNLVTHGNEIEFDEENLNLYLANLTKEYHLSEEELQSITTAFSHYKNAVKKYHLFDVAFEKDNEKRVAKILEYNLSDDDIEEAFFLPLQFDEKVLIGRSSEEYHKRLVIKNLIQTWDKLSSDEQENLISNHNLTTTEVTYITSKKKTLNEVKEKVKTKRIEEVI